MDGIGISIYKPIAERNAFRLLRLKASKEHDSPIECQLVPVTFDYTGDYSALSYTWGDAESSKEITLNGQPHLIRPNLHAVFLRLREKWDTDLWVDALCINQQDVPERNAQVTQMRYIYANAARVIVWLGESSNDADLACDFIQKFSEMHNPTTIFPNVDKMTFLEDYFCHKSWFPSWLAVANLFRRPYFRRIWIIQEIVCAKDINVYCGRHKLSWDNIILCDEVMATYWGDTERFKRKMDISEEDFTRILVQLGPGHKAIVHISEWRSKYAEEGFLILHWLLIYTTAFDATEPRDKIYAILGLASEETRHAIEIDYNISISTLFTDVTRRILLEHQTFDGVPRWLSVARGKFSTTLPSWVPDYTRSLIVGSHYQWPRKDDVMPLFRAGLPSKLSVGDISTLPGHFAKLWSSTGSEHNQNMHFSREGKSLCCKGIEVDTVTQPHYPEAATSGGLRTRAFFEGTIEIERLYAERMQRFMGSTALLWWGEVHEDAAEGKLGPRSAELERNVQRDDEEEAELHSAVKRRMIELEGRSAFLAKSGRVGWCMREAAVGDKVCVLLNCGLPYLMRKQSDGTFMIVGECFMYRIMGGEVLDDLNRGVYRLRDFEVL